MSDLDAAIGRRPGSRSSSRIQIGGKSWRNESSGDVGLKHSFASPSGKTTLTDIEVAERLGVSRFTVRSWRLKGVGPRFLKMGRAVRYRPQDVDEYERQALVETQTQSDHGPM